MVKKQMATAALLVFTHAHPAFAQNTQNASSAVNTKAAPTNKIRLSQKEVAELVLKQGFRTREVNLQSVQTRLETATALSTYDWKLTAESGYFFNKSQSFSPSMLRGEKYEQYETKINLGKQVAATGTLLGIEAIRLSQQADVPPSATPGTSTPNQQTQDKYGLTLEQPLLANFMGMADRATVNAANTTYEANEILRANQLEDVALEAIRLFWQTYVAQENFKESLNSRDRTKKLLDSVKRKTSLGYSNPGDLSQTQAQYEAREQQVKLASVEYLKLLEQLLTSLQLQAGSEVEFVVPSTLPPVPNLGAIEQENLRAIRSQKMKVSAAEDNLTAAKSKRYPSLNLVGKIYTTGSDETSDGSYSNAASGRHPQYYAGVKVLYNFGSDFPTEDVINKKAIKDLEEARLNQQLLQTQDNLAQAERQVQATYTIAQSTQRQKDYLEKAVQELNRTYTQGRTDIKTLIDVMNTYFTSQVDLSRAIGNYQIALNELAASRDELISESKENK